MWDHIFFGPTCPFNVATADSLIWNPVCLARTLAAYPASQSGLLSSNGVEFLVCEKISDKNRQHFSKETLGHLQYFGDDRPEVEGLTINGYVGDFSTPLLSQPSNGKSYAGMLGALVAPCRAEMSL